MTQLKYSLRLCLILTAQFKNLQIFYSACIICFIYTNLRRHLHRKTMLYSSLTHVGRKHCCVLSRKVQHAVTTSFFILFVKNEVRFYFPLMPQLLYSWEMSHLRLGQTPCSQKNYYANDCFQEPDRINAPIDNKSTHAW